MKKTIIVPILVIVLAFVIKEGLHQSKRVAIMTGFASKLLCSCLFTSNMPEEMVLKDELGFPPISSTSSSIDYEDKKTTTSVFGMMERTSSYIPGNGCVIDTDDTSIRTGVYEEKTTINDTLASWFNYNSGDSTLSNIQLDRVVALVDEAFEENFLEGKPKNTRAVVVVKNGSLIVEKYAKGISKDTPLLGWSMTKSLIGTIVGTMINDGEIQLDNKIPYEDWQQDERKNITYRHLLNMNSGLKWEEDYSNVSIVTNMLFKETNMGLYAAQFPLENQPGEKWYYSSGTTNLLSFMLSRYFAGQTAYKDYIYEKLKGSLGMGSLLIESDAAGYPIGSSYGWASARDWAKLGQLYLNNGRWGEKQILDPDWVSFVRTPVEGSNGEYGGHFWLNTEGERYPSCPRDMYFCDGYQGQRVFIVPSHQVVIVRLGAMYSVNDNYLDSWVKGILGEI